MIHDCNRCFEQSLFYHMIFDQLQFEQSFIFGLTVRLVKLRFLKKLQQINQFSSSGSFWDASEVSKKKFWAIQVWRVDPFEKKFQFITWTEHLKTRYKACRRTCGFDCFNHELFGIQTVEKLLKLFSLPTSLSFKYKTALEK